MTRILSYNIQGGGQSMHAGLTRTAEIITIIRAANASVVGLVEGTNPLVAAKPRLVEYIAKQLDMQMVVSEYARHRYDHQPVILSKRPIVYARVHACNAVLTKALMEVCVEEENGQQLTIFLAHLSAAFNQGWAGEHIRSREVEHILHIMKVQCGRPHILMGDFNALAPGEPFYASELLRHIVAVDTHPNKTRHLDGEPNLDFVLPPQIRFLKPILRMVVQSKLLSRLFDQIAALYAPRSSASRIRKAGYIDCFRHTHRGVPGFTYPATAPAGRIDFIYASPELANRLLDCTTITIGNGVQAMQASDHIPIVACFA